MSTLSDLFETLKAKVAATPEKVANLNATYQFELAGDGGGTYHAAFANGTADIGPGPADGPGCTVIMSADDFMAMVAGKLPPTTAFMSGKLKVKGDMGLAMKLQSILI